MDQKDKFAVYASSKLHNGRWKVGIKPQDVCIFAFGMYFALLIY